MFSMVLKDILIIRKIIFIGFAYMVFFLFAFESLGSGAFVSGVVALTHIFIMSSSAYEEKNNTDIVLNSLPVHRKEIVLSKYIAVCIYLMISIIIFFIMNTLIKTLDIGIGLTSISGMDVLLAAFSVSLLNSLYLPIFFKFGYIKSRIFNLLLFLSVFVGATSIGDFIQNNDHPYVKAIINALSSKSEGQISLYMIALILILMSLSFLISLLIYRKKEF